MLAGQRLPHRDAERELIATWITDEAEQALGRDVAQGSERTVGLAQLDALVFLAVEMPREPEVTDGHAAVCPHHHVGGLEIVVHEPAAVSRCEAVAGLDVEIEDHRRVARGHQPAAQIGLGVLERQEWRAPTAASRTVFADVVHGEHVGVVEPRHRPSLTQRQGDLIGCVAVEQLERDATTELSIDGLVHDREGAVSQGPQDFEPAADQAGRVVGLDWNGSVHADSRG